MRSIELLNSSLKFTICCSDNLELAFLANLKAIPIPSLVPFENKVADYIIDLGPEGGNGGGEVVAAGTPEEIVKCSKSYTGKYLKPLLERKVK